jgi:hypothetical protein
VASPTTVLPWLVGGAVGLGGVLQGLHWRSTNASADLAELQNQLRIAHEENALLQRENESLRSLAQGGGEFPVPQELVDRIEAEFELRFLSSPVVHRIAREELRDRVTASIESRYGPAGIDDREEAYKLIGWLRPQDRLLAQLAAVRAVGARGWFDDVTGESWVTDQFNIENIPDQAALLRLLARTLLHQHFPPPPGYPGDDAARARDALHQGAAAGSESRYLAANARHMGFMPMREDEDAAQLLLSLSPFIHGITMFPILDGKGLADTLHVRGNETLHEALRNPPQTTRQITFPNTPPVSQPLTMPAVPEEPFLRESAGLLGLRLWLDELGDVAAAMEVATSRVDDAYLLVPDGESSAAVVWEIEFESPAATDRFLQMALERVSTMAGNDEVSEIGEAVESAEGRFLRMDRPSPTRARFLNLASARGLVLQGSD